VRVGAAPGLFAACLYSVQFTPHMTAAVELAKHEGGLIPGGYTDIMLCSLHLGTRKPLTALMP
jgi:hypothetical protein